MLHNIFQNAEERKNIPSARSVKYIAMAEAGNWPLITSLVGGRRTMIAQEQIYLPKQEAEKDRPYKARLSRTFLFEGFNDTVDKLSSKPFSRKITIQEEPSEKLQILFKDVDKTGKSLTQFARELLTTGLRRGLTHILIDFPVNKKFDDEGKEIEVTKADENAIDARPTFSEIAPTNLIDWHEDHQGKLIYARWIENSVERKSRFIDETKERIREMTDATWTIFERDKSKKEEDQWTELDSGTHTFGRVPIVTFYTEQTGSRTATPPLRKLAEANLMHYQSGSDQRNLLNVARAGILLLTGFNDEDTEDGVEIGPRAQLTSANENADAKWVEHGGKAIEAGRKDLQDIENYMTILGTEPLVIKPGNRTATADLVDEGKSQSAIQTWIRLLESALEEAYSFAAEWVKETLPEKFAIDIFNEFGITLAGKKELDLLLASRLAKQITQETFLKELKRRGVLTESVDVDTEIATTEEETPDLANMFSEESDGNLSPNGGEE